MRALIFDYDGVIVLSERPRFNFLQKTALKYGVSVSDKVFPKMVGRSSRAVLEEVLNLSPEIVGKIIDEFERVYKANIEQYIEPNRPVVEFVKEFQKGGTVLALVSMSSKVTIDKMLKLLGLNTKFKVVVTRDEIVKHKPDPEIYLKALDKLNMKPTEAVAIEDTRLGVESALNAGMSVFALLNGFNSKEDFKGLNIEGFVKTKQDLEKIVS